jgi:hypothetical protein
MLFRRFFDKGVDFANKLSSAKWLNDLNLQLDDFSSYINDLISSRGAASGIATLDTNIKVIQNPANATATPTASKIPIADANGKLDGWISGPYSSGTWTPTFTNLTVVNGTGGATYSGSYIKIGKLVHWRVLVSVTGTCTTASTQGSTYHDLPVAQVSSTASATVTVSDNSITAHNVGLIITSKAYTPTWTALNGSKYISGWYESV